MFKKMCDHSNGWRPEDGVPDLTMMSDITADGINVNLRTRYMRDQIYTFSGSILLAVNPYKQLDIYNDDWNLRYRQRKLDQIDPHIFALTEAMYMNLVMQGASSESFPASPASLSSSSNANSNSQSPSSTNLKHQSSAPLSGKQASSSCNNKQSPPISSIVGLKNQACIISGESGAGKTETTKFILSYLCAVTPNKSVWMEHQILEANTILEAFGNAKTVRNDNSSRFGKFIQICFDSRHQINGCIIQDYLLEQSRITYQSIGERNYHVFYQLLAAGQTNEELRRKYHLMPANFYDYLNKTQCYTIDDVNDCAMFDSLRTAMSVLNMNQENCNGLFSILSAVLWLGNLQFRCDDTDCQIGEQCQFTEADLKILAILSELLGVERCKLEGIMLKRQISVRGSVTEIPFKLPEARDNRNGMAKVLYSRLFSWVVNFINASTNPDMENICFLGVLDIFGFENFESNSFEQLCINYANEKLHKFFNQHMFAMEQELYRREGIEFCDINFTDNTPCLELLERPPNCILRLLSEECRMPKGNDGSLIEKLHTEFTLTNPNPFYGRGQDRRNWSSEFSVKHFAGKVTYNIHGFVKKNKDSQQTQLIELAETSSNSLLIDIIQCESSRDTVGFNTSMESCTNSLRSRSLRQGSIDSQITSSSSSSLIRQIDQDDQNRSGFRARLRSQQSFCVSTTTQGSGPQIRRDLSFNLDRSKRMTNSLNNPSKSKPTVADAFRHQLASLVDLLSKVNPWYVRCIKPNPQKSATIYDDRQVMMQLEYLGMSDLIRIRREGYPIHLTKHQFVCRYRCLMLKHLRMNPSNSPIELDDAQLDSCCRRMINHFQLDSRDWRIGKTMVFLRANVYQPMEERRNDLFIEMATLIQSFWRGHIQRREYTKLRTAAIRVQDAFRAFRDRLLYLRKKRALLTIQAYCRGMFAREIANAMREIKRAEQEKAKRQLEEQRLIEQQMQLKHLKVHDETEFVDNNNNQAQIVITEAPEIEADAKQTNGVIDGNLMNNDHSPSSNVSPAVSSFNSWAGQDISEARQRLINSRDRKEMEDLVKVLESHGISLDALEKVDEKVYANFEKLYDVLGSQLHTNCDTNSISTSVNDDDHCSFVTTATNGDGDSISCTSSQTQMSSTVTDDQLQTCEKKNQSNYSGEASQDQQVSDCDGTVNQKHDAALHHDDDKFHSNSIESIASIVSSTSYNQQSPATPQKNADGRLVEIGNNNTPLQKQSQPEPQIVRTSTFTGNPVVVGGSMMVTNGRPLTRIEEEPTSIASSPSKTPCKSARSQSLFPPSEANGSTELNDQQPSAIKRRRIERRILQVQQDQAQINPTTAGLPHNNQMPTPRASSTEHKLATENPTILGDELSRTASQQIDQDSSGDIDAIYGAQKINILEFAERVFNNHSRDSTGGTMMRTLTRRRRSVDGEYLAKAEMLKYNANFQIPTSHIKMHDPLSAQISCSIFKNLCKYMAGDNIRSDNEVRIIQSIIRHGIDKIELRDEIYIQIIRQLTNNPNNEYCLRLWVLLGLVSASFPPSKNFSKHLFEYLRTKPRKDSSITCHAQFCLDNLQAVRLSARKLPPSPLEIQACKTLSNLTCKIQLLDGRCETVGLHPCDTAIDVLTKLAHKINLQSIEGWALYETYTSGASKYPHSSYEQKGDFERTVKSITFMADLFATWQDGIPKSTTTTLKLAQRRLDEGNFKLIFKKKIFRGPKIRNDPVEINLLYAQAVFNVVKKDCYFVDENLALSLAGLQAQILLGNATNVLKQAIDNDGSQGKKVKVGKQTSGKIIIKSPAQIYDVDSYICLRLRNQAPRSKKEWCNLICQSHKQFHTVNELFCKMRYLSMVIYHCPLYGTATFDVTYKGYEAIDQNLMLGVNADGLVLIRASDKALISAYRYSDICQERAVTVYLDEKIIQLNVRDRSDSPTKCLTFESGENEEIASLMISYSPMLPVHVRGSNDLNVDGYVFETNFDPNIAKRKTKLKMTLEDRMRIHQEVQSTRKSVVKTGKLRKTNIDEQSNPGLLKHTLRKFSSSSKIKAEKISRFDQIYGTLGKNEGRKATGSDIPQTSSDYNIYGASLITNQSGPNSGGNLDVDMDYPPTEVAGATAVTTVDELTRAYPHRYWAYTKYPLKNSLLVIFDPDLEEAALTNFNGILTYSGLLMQALNGAETNFSASSTLDSSSIDSGIASQQSLAQTTGKASSGNSNGSPPSITDIYDVCPKKLDERELIKLAQGILDRCLKKDADILKNELFLQLIKQTTDHPDPNSDINKRHWQLLALACSVTYPSDSKILAYLFAHLRRCSMDQISNEGQYAQFTLRGLQGTLDTKGRKYAPSEMEILSTINCRRVYARVYFLDGQFQAVEFDPCATIAEVVEQIKHKIGLKPDCAGYALFQPLDEDCEQVLRAEEKVGDAISCWESWQKQKFMQDGRQQQRQQQQQQATNAPCGTNAVNKASISSLNAAPKLKAHKFVFKKYLFLDNSFELNDSIERELLYYQTIASIKEDKFPILEQEATILCALKAQIEIGDYTKLANLSREHIRMVYKQVVMSLMPPHTFNNLQAQNIAQQHQAFKDLTRIDAKKYFFNLIQSFGRVNSPNGTGCIMFHRSHVYDVEQNFATAWPSDIWIVINHSGLHLMVARSRRILATCEYRHIIDYNSSSNNLMIILMVNSQNRVKYIFNTKQAQQIAQQIKDYIVISSTSNGDKRRKSVGFNLR